MLGNLTGWHLLIILAVVLLIFGASKLPGLAKAMGQSARILKSEIATAKTETTVADAAPAPEAVPPTAETTVTAPTTGAAAAPARTPGETPEP